jgi:hypothetical protein
MYKIQLINKIDGKWNVLFSSNEDDGLLEVRKLAEPYVEKNEEVFIRTKTIISMHLYKVHKRIRRDKWSIRDNVALKQIY